jgi:hypothetical protein
MTSQTSQAIRRDLDEGIRPYWSSRGRDHRPGSVDPVIAHLRAMASGSIDGAYGGPFALCDEGHDQAQRDQSGRQRRARSPQTLFLPWHRRGIGPRNHRIFSAAD